MIYLLEKDGKPSMVKTATSNTIELAKDFLNNYQLYTGNTLFGELKSTLSAEDSNRNITKTIGNMKLEVTNNDGYSSFKWYYSSNDVSATFTKFITLVYKDGFLSGFIDNWQLYNIGSTNVKLTEQQAKAIALDITKTHILTINFDTALSATKFNASNVQWVSLIFDGSVDADTIRSKDLLELYPVWRVGVALDKLYGQHYGLEVEIWADTGQVRAVQEAWLNADPTKDSSFISESEIQESSSQIDELIVDTGQSSLFPSGLILNIGLVLLVFGSVTSLVILVMQRKKNPNTLLLKPRCHKKYVVLLLVALLSILVLMPVEVASAATRIGVIWGSESSGATGYPAPAGPSWRKHSTEVSLQQSTAASIASYFGLGGWTAQNNQGTQAQGSIATNINSQIQTYSDSYTRLAFIDFDYGNGHDLPSPGGEFHFIFEDQIGTSGGDWYGTRWNNINNAVYDKGIYTRVDRGKTMFAFINTCNSASLVIPGTSTSWQGMGTYGAKGLPYAFTQGRTVVDKSNTPGFNLQYNMSDDAYGDPDDGSQVFIGFQMGSASLMQKIPYPNGIHTYQEWVLQFFYHILYYNGVSVNSGLDLASIQIYGMFFSNPSNPLRSFTSYWWMPPGYTTEGPGSLQIYGNGRMQLRGLADDFDDGNYNGWTPLQGSWTVASGKLITVNWDSLIRTNEQLVDRHVRANVRTTITGPNSWNTAWVIAKYDSMWNNMIYALIHTNGVVELSAFRNGQKLSWATNPTGLNPATEHYMDVDIIGTKAYVYVDGNLMLSPEHDWFDDFGGYTALYSHGDSMASFDDVTIIKQ